MNITTIQSGPMLNNTYLLESGGQYAIVDPGQHNDALKAWIHENSPDVRYIICTHGHFDHVVDTADIKELTGGKVMIHREEETSLYDDRASLFATVSPRRARPVKPDILLGGGESFTLGGESFSIIHTPGHSRGSVCVLAGDMLITGDTLFHGDCGRTDLPGGDFAALRHSVKDVLGGLPGDYRVFPGHEEGTTLDEERAHNPMFR